MKRIISAILCLSVILSLAAIHTFAYGELNDLVTSTNKMVFSTDKDVYVPGDEIVITASMESIWGDPALVGDVYGWEGLELPGAYGMELLIATLIFPLETFTPKAGKSLDDYYSSTIENYDHYDYDVKIVKTSLPKAKAGGYYTFIVDSAILNADEDHYAFFNGSGDLWQYKLTVNEDAEPGVYRLPVGPYYSVAERPESELPSEFEFFGQWYAWIDNHDSNLIARPCDYGAGYGRDTAYIEIVVKSEHTSPDDPADITTVPPTCTEGGYTSFVCTECGKTITTKFDPTGHTLSTDPKDTVTVPPTCNDDGYTSTICTVCEESIIVETYNRTGHTISNDPTNVITTPATCTEWGHTVTYCSVCHNSAKIVMHEPLGHDIKTVKVDAACTADGYEYTKCANEGCDAETEKIVIPKYDHKNPDGTDAWGESFIETKPTTNSTGLMSKTCTLCGDKDYKEIPVLDILYGDCDMNGKIDLNDVSILMKYWSEWEDLYFSSENADVTHDDTINLLDALKILKHIAKWDVDLGAKDPDIE